MSCVTIRVYTFYLYVKRGGIMANYNPYENMLQTLDLAADTLGIPRNDYEVLRP